VCALLQRSQLPVAGVTEDIVMLLARDDSGRIVGTAGLEEFDGAALLRSVAVAPEVRGLGLGIRLTRAALDVAASRGHTDVFLLTTTAAGFFPKCGFVPVERAEVPDDVRRSVEFVSACPSTALAMRVKAGQKSALTHL
jgi:amino-acid N-acetyltransferase